jgi:2-aminoethylphosphonate-pyruvate transaminase
MDMKISSTRDKLLFTPGPLTTSRLVRQAMLRDVGSRDAAFIQLVRDIRSRLLAVSGVAAPEYEAILMQGSGTFSVESVIGSTVRPGGKLLAIVNGAYGRRIVQIAKALRIHTVVLRYPDDGKPNLDEIDKTLSSDPALGDVIVVHSETTSGIINPVTEIGAIVKQHHRQFAVDAMSSFGGVALDVKAAGIDFLVSSANKCIEGVPGFGIIIARRGAMHATEGYARSFSLDLLAQWKGLEADGQFRFTPPTHALLAFHQALLEFETEGGVAGRAERYHENYDTLVKGMRALGFKEYLMPADQGPIIVSFRYPAHPRFHFDEFYARLSDKGYVIYPGKVSDADCFRIGCIGRLFPADERALIGAIRETLDEMKVVM